MNQYPVLVEEAIVPASVLAAVPDSFSVVEAPQSGCSTAPHMARSCLRQVAAATSSSSPLQARPLGSGHPDCQGTERNLHRDHPYSDKKEQLIALGADHVIVTEEEDLVALVQSITGGKGARVVFDPWAATSSTRWRRPLLMVAPSSYMACSLASHALSMAALAEPSHLRLHFR